MKQTLGEKLSQLRRENGYTQDDIALKLGITPQAISKWENDLSCPDIMLLPALAKLYHISIDEMLIRSEELNEDIYEKPDYEKSTKAQVNYENLFLKVLVDSAEGNNVKVRIPVAVIKTLLQIGIKIPELSNLAGVNLEQIQLEQLFELIDSGVLGELMRIDTQDGDIVRITVEEA